MVGTILGMLGHQLDEKMLNEIVAEVDEDGSGQIEFEGMRWMTSCISQFFLCVS